MVTNAQTISDLTGPFLNASAHGGAGFGGSVDYTRGPSSNGQVSGVGFTLGPSLGVSISASVTNTWIVPLTSSAPPSSRDLSHVPSIKKLRKIILSGALSLCATSIGLRALLELLYFDSPRQADPLSGRTGPYVVKNVVIYITENLSDVLYWLRWSFYFFGALIVISVILDQIWPSRRC